MPTHTCLGSSQARAGVRREDGIGQQSGRRFRRRCCHCQLLRAFDDWILTASRRPADRPQCPPQPRSASCGSPAGSPGTPAACGTKSRAPGTRGACCCRSAPARAAHTGSPTPASFRRAASDGSEHVGVAVEQRRRQVVQLEAGRFRERDRPLDHALQLAHVAGPVVRQQRVDGRRRQRQRPEGAVPIEKVLGELDDVAGARGAAAAPSRRRRSGGSRDPAGTRRAPPCSASGRLLATMMRVSTARAADAADALDREILDGAQQLRLRGRGQVRHFVEEQRPLVRVLELAAPAAHARSRCALRSRRAPPRAAFRRSPRS